jgi:hypothetical protein
MIYINSMNDIKQLKQKIFLQTSLEMPMGKKTFTQAGQTEVKSASFPYSSSVPA